MKTYDHKEWVKTYDHKEWVKTYDHNQALEVTPCNHFSVDHFKTSMIEMTGYRNDYNLSDVTDLNNATCQQVTTPKSDTSFRLCFQLPTVHDRLTLTAVLDNGDCLDFPATMVYTEGDRSVLTPYNNNPLFCDIEPGKCVFECDCSAMPCQHVYLIILSAPFRPRSLCEICLTWK